jgi:ferric-dicitrate binding protein FerR (iron transport regulator)
MAARRAQARIRYATPMKDAPWRRLRANPASLARMAKRTASAAKPQRRPRGEIDRNYFFGDVLIKTGAAMLVALGMIALYTPFTLMGAIRDGMTDYLAVMGTFAGLACASFLVGRHLRRNATHWDFD